MGSKISKESQSPETARQRERAAAEKAHTEYVSSVVSRSHGSTELKTALINAAEAKLQLREANANINFLETQAAAIAKERETDKRHLVVLTRIHERQTFTFSAALIVIFLVILGLYFTTSLSPWLVDKGIDHNGSFSISRPQSSESCFNPSVEYHAPAHSKDESDSLSPPYQNNLLGDILVVSKRDIDSTMGIIAAMKARDSHLPTRYTPAPTDTPTPDGSGKYGEKNGSSENLAANTAEALNTVDHLDPQLVWTLLLQHTGKKSRMSYMQVFMLLRKELLPELTMGLVAASFGTTVISIAVLTSFFMILPGLPAVGKAVFLFMVFLALSCLGILMGNVDDAVDVPSGVLLVMAACILPLVVLSSIHALETTPVDGGRRDVGAGATNRVPIASDSWCLFLAAFAVFVYSTLQLHLVAYAALVVPTVISASFMVLILLHELATVRNAPPGDGADDAVYAHYRTQQHASLLDDLTIPRMGVLLFLSVLGWHYSDRLAWILYPMRRNIQYPLLTDVASWIEWSCMLASAVWFVLCYARAVAGYHSSAATAAAAPVGRTEFWTASPTVYCGVLVNFAVMLCALWLSAYATEQQNNQQQQHQPQQSLHLPVHSGMWQPQHGFSIAVFGHLAAALFAVMTFIFTIDKVGHKKQHGSGSSAAVRGHGTAAGVSSVGLGELLLVLNVTQLWLASKYSDSLLLVYAVVNTATYVLCKVYQYVQGLGFLLFALLLAIGVIIFGVNFERAY